MSYFFPAFVICINLPTACSGSPVFQVSKQWRYHSVNRGCYYCFPWQRDDAGNNGQRGLLQGLWNSGWQPRQSLGWGHLKFYDSAGGTLSENEPNRSTNFDRFELKTISHYHPMIRSASAQDQGRQVLHTQTVAVGPFMPCPLWFGDIVEYRGRVAGPFVWSWIVYIGSFNDWCSSGCRQFVSLKNPVARIHRHSLRCRCRLYSSGFSST